MLKINASHFVEGVKVLPTPNKSGTLKPRLLIVHDTAGQLDYMTSVSWLRNPQAKASAHFVVGRKGEIVQLAACSVKTWHAGKSSYKGIENVNDFAVGIEIANPGKLSRAEGSPEARAAFGAAYNLKEYGIEYAETPAHKSGWWMPYSQAQLDAVLAIAMALRDRYGIVEAAPHWEISPGRKVDTNPLFPLEWLRAKLAGRGDAGNDAKVVSGTHLRPWPSFNDKTIVATFTESTPVKIQRSGSFFPAGENIPPEMALNPNTEHLWYSITDGEDTGWVLATEVELL